MLCKNRGGSNPIGFGNYSVFDGTDQALVQIPSLTKSGDLLILIGDATGEISEVQSGWIQFMSELWPDYTYRRFGWYKKATGGEPNFTINQTNPYELIGVVLNYGGAGSVVNSNSAQNTGDYVFPILDDARKNDIYLTYACDRSPSIPTEPEEQIKRASYLGEYFGFTAADEKITTAGQTPSRTGHGAYSLYGRFTSILIR